MNRTRVLACYIRTLTLLLGCLLLLTAIATFLASGKERFGRDGLFVLALFLGAIGPVYLALRLPSGRIITSVIVLFSLTPLGSTLILWPLNDQGAWVARAFLLPLPLLTVADLFLSKRLRAMPGRLGLVTRVLTIASAVASLAAGVFLSTHSPDSGREFHGVIGAVDRIVVRDGGFDCCGPVEDDAVLFEVTDSSEVKAVVEHLQFLRAESPCMCCGFPGIDWYQGQTRVALTAVQHGKALRWENCDLSLTEESSNWFAHWLATHGVSKQEIERGCGGPRRGLRRHAALMKPAQACVARGEKHAAAGDLDAAIADFTEAINGDVNFARAYYLRGLAREKKGAPDDAIKDFTEAIWFAEPHILKSRAEAAKFISVSDAPVELDGNLGLVYYARGRLYEKQGEKAKAEEDFAQARKLGYKP